jgi:hypothetical protein
MAGFKFIRAGEEQEADEGQESDGADELQLSEQKSEEQTPLFFWFFFPMGRFVAWEAATGSGRATYFFRLNGDVDQNVAALTSGLALVNFRREPVYLSDDSLEQQPRFHRYAIAARKLPDLRFLRSAFAGRAMHSSLEKWSAQMDTALQQRA